MKRTTRGFILLILFLLVSSSLIVGTIIFYQTVRCYHVVQRQYHYYQRKYLLEGLLNHAINRVASDFEYYYREVESSYTFVPWGTANNISYNGKITTRKIEDEEVQQIAIDVLLSNEKGMVAASCRLIKREDAIMIERWHCK